MNTNIRFNNIEAINFINLSGKESLDILSLRNHESIRIYMNTTREISKEEHFRFIQSLESNKNKIYFAIREIEGEGFLGVVCFNHIDFSNKNATFGIYSNPKARNGKALMSMLKHISFNLLNLHIIFAKVLSTNKRALRFYIKNGFREYGIMPESIKCEGGYIDTKILALRNEEEV